MTERSKFPPGGNAGVPVRVRHLNPERILDGDPIKAEFCGAVYEFGFAAATPWRIYGPYWGNFATVPQVRLGEEPYQQHIPAGCFRNRSTAIRNYHLNMRPGSIFRDRTKPDSRPGPSNRRRTAGSMRLTT